MFQNKLSWLRKPPLRGEYLWWRIASIFVVGAMLSSALFSLWFIYQNIYTTISNTATIEFWAATPQINAVDLTAYDLAQKNLLLKAATTEWPENLRGIFNYADAATTTTGAITEYEKKK